MPTLNIDRLTEPGELFRRYRNEAHPQPCQLLLDTETGQLWCRFDPETDNGRPASHARNIVLAAAIPCLTAAAANQLMDDIAELAQKVLDGSSIGWDGNNHVGRLNPDADEAWSQIIFQGNQTHWAESQLVAEYDPEEWFTEPDATIDAITADTTDDELDTFAAQASRDAATVGQFGHHILDENAAAAYLRQYRDKLRDAGD